jgi:hypothetical protein
MTHLRGLKPHGYCPTWLRHGNTAPTEKKGHRMISIYGKCYHARTDSGDAAVNLFITRVREIYMFLHQQEMNSENLQSYHLKLFSHCNP